MNDSDKRTHSIEKAIGKNCMNFMRKKFSLNDLANNFVDSNICHLKDVVRFSYIFLKRKSDSDILLQNIDSIDLFYHEKFNFQPINGFRRYDCFPFFYSNRFKIKNCASYYFKILFKTDDVQKNKFVMSSFGERWGKEKENKIFYPRIYIVSSSGRFHVNFFDKNKINHEYFFKSIRIREET